MGRSPEWVSLDRGADGGPRPADGQHPAAVFEQSRQLLLRQGLGGATADNVVPAWTDTSTQTRPGKMGAGADSHHAARRCDGRNHDRGHLVGSRRPQQAQGGDLQRLGFEAQAAAGRELRRRGTRRRSGLRNPPPSGLRL